MEVQFDPGTEKIRITDRTGQWEILSNAQLNTASSRFGKTLHIRRLRHRQADGSLSQPKIIGFVVRHFVEGLTWNGNPSKRAPSEFLSGMVTERGSGCLAAIGDVKVPVDAYTFLLEYVTLKSVYGGCSKEKTLFLTFEHLR